MIRAINLKTEVLIRSQFHNSNFLWVMLTCTLRAHVKVPKNRNIAFNDIKNLIFREFNTPQL
jgi:hypothetical protein